MPDFVIGREDFSSRLAEKLGCGYREFRHLYHSDGEPAPRIEADYGEIEGRDVLLVLRGSQRSDYNRVSRNLHNYSRHIENLFYMFRARSVDVLMPYFWLGRQDHNPRTDTDPGVRERDRGRDIGIEWLARDFRAHGAGRIITFTPHFYRIKGNGSTNVADLMIDVLSGVPALARYAIGLLEDGVMSKGLVVVGPDLNSCPVVEEFMKCTGSYFEAFETIGKRRIDDEKVRHAGKIDAKGRDVLIVDDIFSTLGTVDSSIDRIENRGAVDCFAVHGVLPEKGHDRSREMLGRKVRRFVTTDTVDCDYSRASVIPDIAEFFNENKS